MLNPPIYFKPYSQKQARQEELEKAQCMTLENKLEHKTLEELDDMEDDFQVVRLVGFGQQDIIIIITFISRMTKKI